jgi:hypothetical protein
MLEATYIINFLGMILLPIISLGIVFWMKPRFAATTNLEAQTQLNKTVTSSSQE